MDKLVLSENDIFKLVKLVERRPEIWDKSCNKDNDKKRSAWTEIFNEFYDHDWDVIPDGEKKKLEQDLTGKWGNLRDTFIKAVKKGREQQYKNYETLKFLLKNFKSDPLPSTSAEKQPLVLVKRLNIPAFKCIKRTVPALRLNLNKKRKRLPFITKTVEGRSPSLRLKALKLNTATNYIKPPETVTNNVTHPETIANNSMALMTVTNNATPAMTVTNNVTYPETIANNAMALMTVTNNATPPITVTNNVTHPETIANNAMALMTVTNNATPPMTVTNNVIKSSEWHPNINVIDPDESFFLSILPSVKRLSNDDKLEFRMGVLETLRNVRNKTSMQHL